MLFISLASTNNKNVVLNKYKPSSKITMIAIIRNKLRWPHSYLDKLDNMLDLDLTD